MLSLDDVRERHIRRFALLLLVPIFTYFNWGHHLNSWKHVFFCFRAKSNHRLAEELAEDIHRSASDLGETVSLFIIFLFVWAVFDRLMKWWDYDSSYKKSDIEGLLQENTFLRNQLETYGDLLPGILSTFESLIDKNTAALKTIDNMTELTVKVGALFEKSTKIPPLSKSTPHDPEVDLFTLNKPSKKRPLRIRKKQSPQF